MNRLKIVPTLLICLAALQFLIHLSLLLRGTEFLISRVCLDDTFYYVQTAWNVRVYGFPTFDGIHSTNGVQFLWFWMLASLAFIMPDRYSLLYVALFLCAILNQVGYLALWKIAKKTRRPIFIIVMACAWFFLNTRFPYYLNAMENSLHAACFWILLCSLMAALEAMQAERVITKGIIIATLASVLVVWARLDSVIYAGVLYLYLLWEVMRRARYRSVTLKLMAALLPLILFASGILFMGYYLMGGSFIPVSGLVKSDHFSLDGQTIHWLGKSIVRGFRLTFPVEIWRYFLRQPDNIFPPLARETMIGIGTMIALVICIPVVWFIKRDPLQIGGNEGKDGQGNYDTFRNLYGALIVASVLYIIYYSSSGINSTYAVWYLSPFFITCIATGAWIVEWVISKLVRIVDIRVGYYIVAAMGIACLSLTFACLYHLVGEPYDSEEPYTRVAVTTWMKETLSDQVICAAWNAGGLCFLSDRRVINLDGLINNTEYYREVLAFSKISPEKQVDKLIQYLDKNRVEYVIDNRDFVPDGIKARYRLAKRFPISESGGAIDVYKNPLADGR